MQYHLAKLHLPHGGTGMTTYCTSTNLFGSCTNEYSTVTAWENDYYYEETYKALHLNRIILMAGYLARYYAAAIDGLTEKAQCLSDYANLIDEKFNEFGAGGNYKINEDIANESFDEVEGMSQSGNCPGPGGGSSGGAQGVDSNDAALGEGGSEALASTNNVNEANLGTKVGTSGINLGTGGAGLGVGSTDKNEDVGSIGSSDTENLSKGTQSKLNAIYKAKSKAKKDLLNKIGLKDPNKGKNAAARIVSEMKNNFPLKRALEKTLARNGIDMGVATAAIDVGAVEEKSDAVLDVVKVKGGEDEKDKVVKKARFTSYGRGLSDRSPSSNQELLDAVKKDANKIKKKKVKTSGSKSQSHIY